MKISTPDLLTFINREITPALSFQIMTRRLTPCHCEPAVLRSSVNEAKYYMPCSVIGEALNITFEFIVSSRTSIRPVKNETWAYFGMEGSALSPSRGQKQASGLLQRIQQATEGDYRSNPVMTFL